MLHIKIEKNITNVIINTNIEIIKYDINVNDAN
jgi:hypothetical protein